MYFAELTKWDLAVCFVWGIIGGLIGSAIAYGIIQSYGVEAIQINGLLRVNAAQSESIQGLTEAIEALQETDRWLLELSKE